MKIHYGLPGLRTACGHFLHNVSTRRSLISCASCRKSVKFQTAFFSANPKDPNKITVPRSRDRGTHTRNGARP